MTNALSEQQELLEEAGFKVIYHYRSDLKICKAPPPHPHEDAHFLAIRLPDDRPFVLPDGTFLVVLDVDTKHGVDGRVVADRHRLGPVHHRSNVYDGKQAGHYFFRFTGSAGKIHPYGKKAGVEFFTHSRSIFVTPSKCKSGEDGSVPSDFPDQHYNEAQLGGGPDYKDLAETILNCPVIPDSLYAEWTSKIAVKPVERLPVSRPLTSRRFSAAQLEKILGEIRAAVPGSRDETLNRTLYYLGKLIGHGVLDREHVEAEVRKAAEGRYEGIDVEEKIRRSIEAGIRDSPEEVHTFNELVREEQKDLAAVSDLPMEPSDRLFYEALERRCKGLLYSLGPNKWLNWDGRKFKQEGDLAAERYIESLVGDIISADYLDEKQARTMKRYADRFTLDRKRACLRQLSTHLPASLADFDKSPELFAFKNGVFNLVSGEFRPAEPSDMLTHEAGVDYVEYSHHPVFDAFWDVFLSNDEELKRWLFCETADGLHGDNRNQQLFCYVGQSAGNGKSTWGMLQDQMLGDYHTFTPYRTIAAQREDGSDRPSPQLLALHGKRMVTVLDSPDNLVFDDAKVKTFTGGDPLVARGMHSGDVLRVRFGRLTIFANEAPKVITTSHAMVRRLRFIEMRTSFTGVEDRDLPAKLFAEAPSLLSDLCRTAAAQGRPKLAVPRAVEKLQLEEVSGYGEMAESLFLRTGDITDRVPRSLITKLYKMYVRAEGLEDLAARPKHETGFRDYVVQKWSIAKPDRIGGTVYCFGFIVNQPAVDEYAARHTLSPSTTYRFQN